MLHRYLHRLYAEDNTEFCPPSPLRYSYIRLRINVHKYGAHIFHTNNKKVWNYITQFAEFNRFTNSPVANYKGELYSLPFNMYTFNKMWGVVTPEEAAAKIEEQRKEITHEPQNLEEQAIPHGKTSNTGNEGT